MKWLGKGELASAHRMFFSTMLALATAIVLVWVAVVIIVGMFVAWVTGHV